MNHTGTHAGRKIGSILSNLTLAALLLATSAFASAQRQSPEVKNSTSTRLTAPSKVALGASATLTATVTRTSGTGVPSGTVTFAVQTQVLGTASLNGSGVATFSASSSGVAMGVYGVHATYQGNSTDSRSVSPTVNVAVAANTATSLIAAPTGVQLGQAVNLRATVTRTGASGNPGGTVTFYYGKTEIGSAYVVNGLAVLSASSAGQPLGAYPITASYNGDAIDIGSSSANVTVTITPAADVLTHRNNLARTGVQPAETMLTPANVNTTQFGKLFSLAVDGYLYTQPLFVSAYTMNDGKSHNVLYAATANGTVYAFDADGNNPTSGYLWSRSLLAGGEQIVTPSDYFNCGNPSPASSIIGTPVIDRVRGVLYVVGKTKLVGSGSTTYYHRIHALSLVDGSDQLNGPTVITATVPGTGGGSSGGNITFNPLHQNERAALTEAEGTVWVTYASHCDIGPYHGWTFGYNAADLSQTAAVYNNTPNGNEGGIWMAAGGLSADNLGHIFSVAGNGTFDANDGGPDYSDAVQRFNVTANSLTPVDYFTPSNQAYLSSEDLDLGTGDGILFDDPASSVAPHLLATPDKTGRIYLLNRDKLGGYDTGTNGPDSLNGDLQDFATASHIFTSFGYFNSRLYVGVDGHPLAAYNFTPGTSSTAGSLATTPSMQTGVSFNGGSETGAQLSISANGTQNAIVWAMYLGTSTVQLFAFDANNLSTELYASTQNNTRDLGPAPVKFTAPVIANGKVYVGGQGQVAVYGLLPLGMQSSNTPPPLQAK
jgi:hypothetical protein